MFSDEEKKEQETYQNGASLSPLQPRKGLPHTYSQKVDQERHAIQFLRSFRRSVLRDTRKLPIDVARKVSGQPCRKIGHQSLAGDLRQHASQAVADGKLDTSRGALFDRRQAIADFENPPSLADCEGGCFAIPAYRVQWRPGDR
jgi:hypothetical protein